MRAYCVGVLRAGGCSLHRFRISAIYALKKLKKRGQLNMSKLTKVVYVPLTLDSEAEVNCPYCDCGRTVEPDANYTVICGGCGREYMVESEL